MIALRKLILLAVLIPVLGRAQSYSIPWHKFPGGGGSGFGTNASGNLALGGSIGQPDAGGAMSGGPYSLASGFWVTLAVQTPGAPLLSILATNGMIMISWPSSSASFNLQVNADLTSTNWTSPSQTVQTNGANLFILVNPPSGNRFFRLVKP